MADQSCAGRAGAGRDRLVAAAMRTLRIQRTPHGRNPLPRHRWYVALGDARPTRVARSHAAAYRAMREARKRGISGFWYGGRDEWKSN